MARPRASWLQQVDRHLKEIGMGQASAWGMARRRPLEYRRKVDAATRCSCACSHTLPDATIFGSDSTTFETNGFDVAFSPFCAMRGGGKSLLSPSWPTFVCHGLL